MTRASSAPTSSNERRRAALLGLIALAVGACARAGWFERFAGVNAAQGWPQREAAGELHCMVDVSDDLGKIDARLFGSNLEWFNDGDGLAGGSPLAYRHLVDLAREAGITVWRYPGGTLADYYDWHDGIGPQAQRPQRQHPTDSGISRNNFGSPEFFGWLRDTGGQGLVTVNAGTGSADEAAAWVSYANRPGDAQRRADGLMQPIGIKLWEIGNELYLPGNPGEKKIMVTPEVYADRFVHFADAMRAVDPSITLAAIGVAPSHAGPDSPFPDWTDKLLQRAADRIDLVAVHNAYFPLLYGVQSPKIRDVYSALWASPEAVDASLNRLDDLIQRYEHGRHIGIAITEWGALFSLPFADREWVDHVKTIGSGVYVGRMLQVFMSHPRVELANYFKFTDRSFMGWINYAGQPKVPHRVFELYARYHGDRRVQAQLDSPTFDTPAFAVMWPQQRVATVTAVATRNSDDGTLYLNFVNRSFADVQTIRLDLRHYSAAAGGELLSISAAEPTAHEGRDIPPEWPYRKEYEPFSTAPEDSIRIQHKSWSIGEPIRLPPFSVATLVLKPADPSFH